MNHETRDELVLETIDLVVDEGGDRSFMDLIESVSSRLECREVYMDPEEILEIYNGMFHADVGEQA